MNTKLILNLLCLLTVTPVFAVPEQELEQAQTTDELVSTQQPTDKLDLRPVARMDLSTTTGFEVGGQISSYRYQEGTTVHTDFMHETGAKFGIAANARKTFQSGIFVMGDMRFAYSSNDYASASGKQHDINDYLGEVRFLIGKDWIFNDVSTSNLNFGLSPYIGIGYRNLFNDARGTSSLGAHGYRRDSQYIYLPVGLTHRFRLSNNARISTSLEYDELLFGQQESDLSDVSPAYPNLTNDQHGGYGLRGSLMYERASWSVGPFFNYWNINKSDIETSGRFAGGNEPRNQTIEYGLQVRFRF